MLWSLELNFLVARWFEIQRIPATLVVDKEIHIGEGLKPLQRTKYLHIDLIYYMIVSHYLLQLAILFVILETLSDFQ